MVKEVNHCLSGHNPRVDRFRKIWVAIERALLLAWDSKFFSKIFESDGRSSTLSDGGKCLSGDEERSEGKDKLHRKGEKSILLEYNTDQAVEII